ERYRNEALAFLREPLEDLCISRPKSRLTWGITLPFDADYVTYVWFDALINYVTALGYPDGARFDEFWPVAQHLIAKDILKPHGIYWPTMLKAAGIEPYRNLNVHGYWNVDASKMSKSLGNVVKPLDLKDKYGLDPFRYFLLRDMVFGLDSNFSEEAFVQRINADLANDLGNLVSRTLTMAAKFLSGQAPAVTEAEAEASPLPETARRILAEVEADFAELGLHKALMVIWEFINVANKYIVENEPWTLVKEPERRGRLEAVLYSVLEALRVIAVLIAPFMPSTAEKILSQLGIEGGTQDFDSIRSWGGLPAGSRLTRGEALFPRVEFRKEAAPMSEPKEEMVPVKPEIAYEDFARVDLRVATILEAEAVPKSNKLVRLKIDLGEERQIVAGIAKDYPPETLVGKKIVVVANLKPTKLMGVESRGMLLATDTPEGLTLIGFDRDPKTGAPVR
ncbi:MAG: methionine--tRNA ligase subunit beta, partial [Syntrophales bacterium]|nr:methionine--tRNA ligase subunit beta [Syntrophales bacterium]